MLPTLEDLFSRKDVAHCLPVRFDPERLARDLALIDVSWWHEHRGHYHDGQWQSISLLAPGGDRTNQFSHGGAFAPTEALGRCEYMHQVIETFPGRKNRVRLLRLRPGGRIFLHSDPIHQIDRKLVRLHVPVQTNPDVIFTVNGLRVCMKAGEVWHVDVRFPHMVHNAGTDDRVHLVVDIAANSELLSMLGAGQSAGKGWLTGYFLKHALPVRLIRRLGIGN